MAKNLYGFTQEQVNAFRAEYAKCLRDLKNVDGSRAVPEDHVRDYLSISDDILSYEMQYNTPQSLAEIDVM